MAKTLQGMSPGDLMTYMNLLSQATETIVPEDAVFVIVLVDPTGHAHWVKGSKSIAGLPEILANLAVDVEATLRGKN